MDGDKPIIEGITFIEIIILVIGLIFFAGLSYCVWQINDMKYQSLVIKKLTENEQWRNDVTIFLNYNVHNGKLLLPDAVPQVIKPK
jgi:hypothetical protein